MKDWKNHIVTAIIVIAVGFCAYCAFAKPPRPVRPEPQIQLFATLQEFEAIAAAAGADVVTETTPGCNGQWSWTFDKKIAGAWFDIEPGTNVACDVGRAYPYTNYGEGGGFGFGTDPYNKCGSCVANGTVVEIRYYRVP